MSVRARRIEPQFTKLAAFDFYDGIETAVGCYANGETVRFKSLADSNFRIFRAFEFAVIDGNWIEKISRMPTESLEYSKHLESEIFSMTPISCFVGVASLNVDWVKLTEISIEALTALRNPKRPNHEIYLEVHRLAKSGKSD